MPYSQDFASSLPASPQGYSESMPSSFGSANPANCTFSIYASYIPDSQEDTGLTGNPYMFTGRRFDIETGLYYYRARYYNPYIGRFLQIDPHMKALICTRS